MQLCDVVRETGFAIHRYHKHGHLEKVYENALTHRLRKLGLEVKQQYPLKVYDEDGTLIGDYSADVFVDMRAFDCLQGHLRLERSAVLFSLSLHYRVTSCIMVAYHPPS